MNTLISSLEYQKRYIDCIKSNQVSIITADTGSGKTMFTAHFLKRNNVKSIITQPRIPNVYGVVSFIKNQYDQYVGYKTSDDERDINNSTLVVTDGLLSAMGHNLLNNYNVLVVDECHEFNMNMEDILFLAKERLSKDSTFKLIILSATLDNHIEKLKNYFNEYTTCHEHFEGRKYEIKEIYNDENMITNAAKSSEKGSVLVFLPSIADLYMYKRQINYIYPNIRVETLSSESDDETRKLIFNNEHNNIIWLATNIAQAGLTPSNVKTVIITGYKYINSCDKYGNSVLKRVFISKEDFTQQKGRTGRTHEGECIICIEGRKGRTYNYNDLPDTTPVEIQRISLDSLYLRYSYRSLLLENIQFIHNLDNDKVLESKQRLIDEELITNEGIITQLGKEVSKLSINPFIAKNIILAKQFNMSQTILLMSAIIEFGNKIYDKFENLDKSLVVNNSELFTSINILKLFINKQNLPNNDKNIKINNLMKVKKIYELLNKSIKVTEDKPTTVMSDVLTQLYKKYIFIKNGGSYINLSNNEYYRCDNCNDDIIFGIPYIIENNNLIQYSCPINVKFVEQNMEKYITKLEYYEYKYDLNKVVKITKYKIKDIVLKEEIDETQNYQTKECLYKNQLYSLISKHKEYYEKLYYYSNGEIDKRIDYPQYLLDNNINNKEDYNNNSLIIEDEIEFDKKHTYNTDFSITISINENDLNNLPIIENREVKYYFNYRIYTKEQLADYVNEKEQRNIQQDYYNITSKAIRFNLDDDYNFEPIELHDKIFYPYMQEVWNDLNSVDIRYTESESSAETYTKQVLYNLEEKRRNNAKCQIILDDDLEYNQETISTIEYKCNIYNIDGFTFYVGYKLYKRTIDTIFFDNEEDIKEEWKKIERLKLADEYNQKHNEYYNRVHEKIDELYNVNRQKSRDLQSYYDRLGNMIYKGEIDLNENTFNELELMLNETGKIDYNSDVNQYEGNFRITTNKRKR